MSMKQVVGGSASVVMLTLMSSVAVAGELTIVPFAVPVAVPVAVVQQPTLFYGISQYAPPSRSMTENAVPLTLGPSPTKGEESQAELRERVDAVLVKRCAECHHGDRLHGDLTLFDADGRPFEKLPRQWLVEVTAPRGTEPAAMPPGEREKLSDQERQTLQQWARMPKSFVY